MQKEKTLQEVIVTDQRDRREAGLIRPNPKTILNLPSAVTGVESLIKIFVGSNNELTSQYSVRGGSYDENLIYVNDFEVFRPYLIPQRPAGRISFINLEMVKTINFYNGGFQAKYGDKMSSVLDIDIQYKKPKRFGGSAFISILEQGLNWRAQIRKINSLISLAFIIASNRNLLSRQDTKEIMFPSSNRFQALLSYQFSPKWQAELLIISSEPNSRWYLKPVSLPHPSSPILQHHIRNGCLLWRREKDQYQTNMLGFSLSTKWIKSFV